MLAGMLLSSGVVIISCAGAAIQIYVHVYLRVMNMTFEKILV